jgi:pimeloyl-ACP methyl ester carboxylesterase
LNASEAQGVTECFAEIAGDTLECRLITAQSARKGMPTLVFLHEGLGSVQLWRDTPERLCTAVGCDGLVYSRMGYGASSRLIAPRPVKFMEREAEEVLPLVLDHFAIERPLLVGHSDGGSIALIYASLAKSRAVAALVMAAHVFVEDIALDAIAATREAYLGGALRERLRRFHDDVDGAFFGWNDIWLDADFAAWTITSRLAGISCPVVVIQGEDDEYGTMAQVDALEAHGARAYRLARCRHSPHRDQPEAVKNALVELLHTLAP